MSGISITKENEKSPSIVSYDNYRVGKNVELNESLPLYDGINLHKMRRNYIIFTTDSHQHIALPMSCELTFIFPECY